MKRASFALTLCACAWVSTGCGPRRPGEMDAGVDAGVCVDKVLCIRGTHWDPEECMCVPDPGAATGGASSAGSTCVDTVLCIRGDHWDNQLCRCVPDSGAATGGAGGVCVDTVLCIKGDHWDNKLCRCVAD